MARGRMPGPGGIDVNALMKQVQQMQAEMCKAQEQLKDEVVEASAGGGMVKVKVSGDLEAQRDRDRPRAVDPEDVEMLQDMVLAAVNEAHPRRPGAGRAQDGRHRRRHDLGGPGRPRPPGTVST